MSRSLLLIAATLVIVSTATVGFWALQDRTLYAPDWAGVLRGVSYSPSGIYSVADLDRIPADRIRTDLEHLSRFTNRVRTYTVDRGLDIVPAEARRLGMTVSLGIWLGPDRDLNEKEIARAIKAIIESPESVDRVFVGSEVVLRGELTAQELAAYITRVNRSIPANIEVGSADVWHLWLDNPVIARSSEFIGVHLLPYWDGVAIDDAMTYIEDRLARIRNKFPAKVIVIAETGWPSEGRMRRGAVATPALEAAFLRTFIDHAARNRYDYYIIEAYDQPWKAGPEGAVGAFWGIFDAERGLKFPLTGALSSFAEWPVFALASAIAVFVAGALLLTRLPTVRFVGYLTFGFMLGVVILTALVIFDSTALVYADLWNVAVAVVIIPTGGFAAVFILTETAEFVASLWRRERFSPPTPEPGYAPFVSVQVPTYNEPPDVVRRTLQQLAALDYPNFEVIVLDNNTSDERLWRPVEACCENLGPQLRFFHMDGVKGFKAGALNKALDVTDSRAEIIAVIDCDYHVEPGWLTAVIPGFVNLNVAVVQAPQDYRDAGESLFKAMTYQEYGTFFHVGMVERNEHNAIIQHGTMTAVRRSALLEVGGWSEWCITEDAELGFKLLEAGYRCIYLPESLGRGLMPDTFAAYKAQRHRWVYGAMQIAKRHAKALRSRDSKLSLAQRYHFIAGWLPWFADAFALVFVVGALVWSSLMIVNPKQFDVPMMALSAVVLLLFLVKVAKTLWLHAVKASNGLGGAIAASVVGLGLSWTVGRAVWLGLFSSSQPFLRTPKCEGRAALWQALGAARAEAILFVLGIVAAVAVSRTSQPGDLAAIVWVMVLVVQCLPHGIGVLVAVVSALSDHAEPLPFVEPGTPLQGIVRGR